MKITFFSFITFILCFGYQSKAQVTNGLVHHYPFDDSFSDVVGNQNATTQGVPFFC